jgi:hypothetical protein
MLDTSGMAKGGSEYRRLVEAFERIFGATIFFGTDSVRGALVSSIAVGSTSSGRPGSGTNETPWNTRVGSVSRT